jgi:hypothetical protein
LVDGGDVLFIRPQQGVIFTFMKTTGAQGKPRRSVSRSSLMVDETKVKAVPDHPAHPAAKKKAKATQ